MNNYTDLDWTKITTKRSGKTYRLYYNREPLKLETPMCSSHTGIQQSGSKNILIVGFKLEDNSAHNFISQIKSLDTHIAGSNIIDTKNKYQSRNIYNNDNVYTMKVQYKDVDIYELKDGVKVRSNISDLKDRSIKMIIELGMLWSYNDSYGVSWNVTEIIIL